MYGQANEAVCSLFDWFKANQLSVNPTKTKYIILYRPGSGDEADNPHIFFIDVDQLERVNNTKFLGLFIDQHLTWEDRIRFLWHLCH